MENVYGKHGVWCGAVKGWLRAGVQLVLALLGFLKIVLIFHILFSPKRMYMWSGEVATGYVACLMCCWPMSH